MCVDSSGSLCLFLYSPTTVEQICGELVLSIVLLLFYLGAIVRTSLCVVDSDFYLLVRLLQDSSFPCSL